MENGTGSEHSLGPSSSEASMGDQLSFAEASSQRVLEKQSIITGPIGKGVLMDDYSFAISTPSASTQSYSSPSLPQASTPSSSTESPDTSSSLTSYSLTPASRTPPLQCEKKKGPFGADDVAEHCDGDVPICDVPSIKLSGALINGVLVDKDDGTADFMSCLIDSASSSNDALVPPSPSTASSASSSSLSRVKTSSSLPSSTGTRLNGAMDDEENSIEDDDVGFPMEKKHIVGERNKKDESMANDGSSEEKVGIRTKHLFNASDILSNHETECSKSDSEVDDDSFIRRSKFKRYWEFAIDEFGLSFEGMMLKKDAVENDFETLDKSEVLSFFLQGIKQGLSSERRDERQPKLREEMERGCSGEAKNGDKITEDLEEALGSYFPVDHILEVGAGVGRFTQFLQKISKKLSAVDFMELYIEENKAKHQDLVNRPGDRFMCADATRLDESDNEYDIIFWNWLLMYLADDEVASFLQKVFKMVKKNGFIFLRESCGEPANKKNERPWALEGNPTEYRPSCYYSLIIHEVAERAGVKIDVLIKEETIKVYQKRIGTNGQRCWLLKRIE